MKISLDTKEDSHEEIKTVIRMLQNIVGESQEIFTNAPTASSASETSPIANIFGDISTNPTLTSEIKQEPSPNETETSESAEDLFAELFSEEELKKMDVRKESEEEEESEEEIKSKPKDKKYGIEFY